jgi:hypothetical protein
MDDASGDVPLTSRDVLYHVSLRPGPVRPTYVCTTWCWPARRTRLRHFVGIAIRDRPKEAT